MANIAIFRINYKSDFILTLESDAGWITPFCIKFWTGRPSQAYFAGYDGTTYTNCSPVEGEPSKLVVQFDDHHLPIGELKFQIGYHFTVDDFPTTIEDEVMNQASVIIEVDDAPAQVMLDLNGETAPGIEFALPAYANEQQRIANEEQRIENEQARVAAEEARVAAENARVSEFAQLKIESEAATANANAAAQLATEKAALAQQKADYAQTQGDYAKAQGDYAKSQGDIAQADHQRAESDHATATADHTQAASDHSTATADHTQAVSDHTQAAADHTQAAADHTRAESDHTRAESDHEAVEVYVDSLGAFDISAYNATGGVLAKYADLTAALGTGGANIPEAIRKGGMSVKFVQSSDNKYVQFKYLGTSTSNNDFIDIANWQEIKLVNKYFINPNICSDKVIELYLTGLDTNKTYKVTNIGYKSSDQTYKMLICDNEENEVARVAQTTNSKGVMRVWQLNSSGITGYALLNIETSDNYDLSFSEWINKSIVSELSESPSIQNYLQHPSVATNQTTQKKELLIGGQVAFTVDKLPEEGSKNLLESGGVALVVGENQHKLSCTANTVISRAESVFRAEIKQGTKFLVCYTSDNDCLSKVGAFDYCNDVGGRYVHLGYNLLPNKWYEYTAAVDIEYLCIYGLADDVVSSGNVTIYVRQNIGKEIQDLKNGLDNVVPSALSGGKNLYNPSNDLSGKYIHYTQTVGEDVNLSNESNSSVSEYIPVIPQHTYSFSATSYCPSAYLVFVDSSKKVVEYNGETKINLTSSVLQSFVAPQDAAYIIVTTKLSGTATTNFQIEDNYEPTAYEAYSERQVVGYGNIPAFLSNVYDYIGYILPRMSLKGKKWVVFGDSITEKNERAAISYYDYIKEELGMEVINKGRSGTGYMKYHEGYNDAFWQRMLNVGNDFDVLTIMGSFNDRSLTLGNWNDTGTSTVCGCINTTIDNFISVAPFKKLGIITPMPWAPSYAAPDGLLNNPYDDYANALVKICASRGIPCLDLYHCSGMRPWDNDFLVEYYNEGGVQDTGSHPSSKGHKLIAPIIKEFILKLFKFEV